MTKKYAAVLVVAAATLTGCTSMMNHQWHRDCTIIDKDMLYSQSGNKHGSSSSRTKRMGTSCGVFNVSDSISGGFNSYDRWVQLQVGKKYDIETGGFRFGIASMFPTVIDMSGPKQ